jgi:TolB protein
MRRAGCALGACIAILVLAPGAPCQDFASEEEFGQDVRIRVREGVGQIHVALPVPESDTELSELGRRIAEVARNDLYFTGLFQIVDPSLYPLIEEEVRNDHDPRVRAKRWWSIGARYLVQTSMRGVGDRVILEAYLVELREGQQLLGRRYQGKREQWRKHAHHLADDILLHFTGTEGLFTSRIVYVSQRGDTTEVYLADYDGAGETQLTRTGSRSLSPTLSPDGHRVAFTSRLAGDLDLFVARVGNGKPRPLLANQEGTEISPAWCRTSGSEKIAFSSSHQGDAEIYVVGSNGTNLRRLTHHPGIDVSPSWSPTCREIAFVSDRAGNPHLFIMDAEGANVRRLTRGRGKVNDPSWSPDGSAVAYARWMEGEFRICVLRLESEEESCLPKAWGEGEAPTWSPDGHFLAYVRDRSPFLFLARSDGSLPARRVQILGVPKTPEWVP